MTEWTSEQLGAIERREGDLLLDAGAGSGKTSVLVERFVRGVLEDGIDVGALLTITFTDKAAAELRERIRARLRELGAPDAARATEGAFISTIHGFCARVLRANALTAGLDPRFVVLDRFQSESLAAVAFDAALDELASDNEGAIDLIASYGAFSLRAATTAVYGQLRSLGDGQPALPEVTPPDLRAAARRLSEAAAVAAAELRGVADPGTKVLEAIERLGRCAELLELPDPWPGELDALKLPGGNGAALSTEACQRYADALVAYRDDLAASVAVSIRDLLDALLRSFGRHYTARKRECSGLDFEDLELMTRDLLASQPELRERYRARFERIMVDELQDTNRVQLELIESVARENLFTVGDAQQSIYGFRHAEVELFEERGERLEAAAARLTLQTNFRSEPEILALLNLAFAGELGERFRLLRPGRAPEPSAEPRIELLLIDKGADWGSEGVAAPWRVAEARALAARIAELIEAGTEPGAIVVLTRVTTDMRAYERALEQSGVPTYVIGGRGYWSHPQVVDMLAYLRALANPADEEALYTVLASPLAGASLDALVVLASASRELERDPWWLLRDPGAALDELAEPDRDRLERFTTWFAEERRRAARAPVPELISAALEQSGYDLAMLAMPGGPRRLANVRKLMRLAREHESDGGAGLRSFLQLAREREGRGGDSRESEAPIEGEGLAAVRLMTIHRAKGLEFEVVCVADLGRPPLKLSELIRVSADGRLGLRLARPGAGRRASALDYAAIGSDQERIQEDEERRLFYVAMTRARERLILSGAARLERFRSSEPERGGPMRWVAPAFVPDLAARIEEGGGVIEREGARLALSLPRPEDLAPEVPPALREAPAPAPVPAGQTEVADRAVESTPRASPVSALSYSSLGEYARCGYRFYVERVLKVPPLDPGPARGATAIGPSGAARPASERGILVHALLERLDFRRPVTPAPSAIAAAAARSGLRPPGSDGEMADLVELVERFAASALCQRLGQATDVRREERFAFRLTGDVLLTGAFDALAREPGTRSLVVDYKSDRLDGADPEQVVAEAYVVQRLIYALAALRAGAEQVEVAHCFLEVPDRPVKATFTRLQVPELERRLSGLVTGVLAREFAVAEEPHRALCAGCPAEGGLCIWPLELTRRERLDRLF